MWGEGGGNCECQCGCHFVSLCVIDVSVWVSLWVSLRMSPCMSVCGRTVTTCGIVSSVCHCVVCGGREGVIASVSVGVTLDTVCVTMGVGVHVIVFGVCQCV